MSLLSVEEVAELLDMSEHWVRRRAKAGDIPFAQLGGRKKFRPADIENYVANHMQGLPA